MATDNADELQAIKGAHRAARTEKDPKDAVEGKTGNASISGNASLTAFTVTHTLGAVPTKVLLTPTSAAASAAHYVSAKAAGNFTVTFVAAPASGTNNVTFDYLVV